MSYITLNKQSFINNTNYYTNILGDINKISIALKDNAYGHGINQMAKLSYECGIKHCMVRDISEALKLKKYNFESILILYEIPKTTYPDNFIFTINCLDSIYLYKKGSKVELKIDTGMGRNGIKIDQINDAIELIKQNELILNGVFTHFHSSDEDDNSANVQEKIFLDCIKYIKSKIKTKFKIHCANTNGVHKVNNNLYDMARIGIGLYGYSSIAKNSVLPVLSLYANKISTRTLNKGDSIGYGAKYIVKNNNTIVSNYDIGYGDGFFRVNENQKALVKNKKQILGRVSMDSFSLIADDEEICVFDNVTHLASVHNTIEYEILTHLMAHIKRVIINS